MIVGDYRAALQAATAPLHDRIDALFGSFDLSDRDGLARFLVAQAIGMQACQPCTTRFARQHLGCLAPDYWQILQNDLAALGVAAEQLPHFELPAETAGGWGDAGVFYVVAGSRMGAAVLRNRATALTPAGPANTGCGYFVVGEGPALWRSFREWLAAAAGSPPADRDAMIDAAKATFQLFARAALWATGAAVLSPTPGVKTAGLAA